MVQSKDAEQMLWKTVFYTVIEEFRRRIKAATAQGQKGSEPLRKVYQSSLLPLLHAVESLWLALGALITCNTG